MVLGTFLHTVCMPAYKVTKVQVAGPRNHAGRTRGLQTERSFSMMRGFRQNSEGVGLSQVSKMLRQLFQLTTLLLR